MITYKSNINKVIKTLQMADPKIIQASKRGMIHGMEFFKSKIIKEQMSGRKREDLGLYRQTGTLAGSWFIVYGQGTTDFTVVLANAARAYYAVFHQNPSSTSHLPKRLYVLEDFKKYGIEIISRQIAKNLFREFGK